MTSKLHAVREACKLDPEDRTEERINDILEFVKDVKFFTKLTNLQQRALCRTMTHEVFGPREYIFQQGDVGDKFYIILSGSVSVQIPSTTHCPNGIHPEKCDCPNRPLETVVFLEKGMGFGELALQSDQPRSATILTSEKTETLVTKRMDYEQYAGQLHRQFIEARVKFLRQFPRIEEALQRSLVSTQDIAAMANCLNETSLSGNQILVRQGDSVENMIFVSKGQLAMLRLVDLDSLREPDGSLCTVATDRRRTRAGTMGKLLKGRGAQEEYAGHSEPATKAQEMQSQQQLTTNLAKLLLEGKKKDRGPKHERHATAETKEVAALPSAPPQPSVGVSKKDGALRALMGRLAAAEDANGHLPSITPRNHSKTPAPMNRGKERWQRLRTSFKQANLMNRMGLDPDEVAAEAHNVNGAEAGARNVQQFTEVCAARRLVAEYNFKHLAKFRTKREGSKTSRSPSGRVPLTLPSLIDRKDSKAVTSTTTLQTDSSSKLSAHSQGRTRLLKIGTIGACQYFGDVFNGELYPVTLMSDPIAEIYLMSKHDVLRRLPKKLFSALFTPDREGVPSDLQIMDMHRQMERWTSYCRTMHAEAISRRHEVCSVPRPLRELTSRSRVDAVANLEFLGVTPDSVPSVVPAPRKKTIALTAKDEELFSQAPASFLRKFEALKKDVRLRSALAKDGYTHCHPLGISGSSAHEEVDSRDPNAFRFEQQWSKLPRFPMGLDHLDDGSDGEVPLLGRSSVQSTVSRKSSFAESKQGSMSMGLNASSGGPGRQAARFSRDWSASGSDRNVGDRSPQELPPLSPLELGRGGLRRGAPESVRGTRRTVLFSD